VDAIFDFVYDKEYVVLILPLLFYLLPAAIAWISGASNQTVTTSTFYKIRSGFKTSTVIVETPTGEIIPGSIEKAQGCAIMWLLFPFVSLLFVSIASATILLPLWMFGNWHPTYNPDVGPLAIIWVVLVPISLLTSLIYVAKISGWLVTAESPLSVFFRNVIIFIVSMLFLVLFLMVLHWFAW
jgi:hypothetical protein